MTWLEEELYGEDLLLFAIYLLFADIITSAAVTHIVKDILQAPITTSSTWILDSQIAPLLFLVAAPLEELVFRMPLALVVRIRQTPVFIFGSAIITSAFFGCAHGFNVWNIPLQGLGGFCYSVLFLKAGGYQRKILKPFICCSGAHFLFNFSIWLGYTAHTRLA